MNGVVVDKWSKPGEVNPGSLVAGGDVDGKPGNEVIACGTDGTVHAYNGNGSLLCRSAAMGLPVAVSHSRAGLS